MNPLFYPSKAKSRESKSGLEKHRKIVHYTENATNDIVHDNIPDSWFYNNENATKIWEGLEVDPAVKIKPSRNIESSFSQIDESTKRIRQMIANYEIKDQELLVNLMDILEQEDEYFGSTQDDALFEAKCRLSSMINDHSGNSDEQGKMLDSLRTWFDSLIKMSQSGNDTEITNPKDTYNINVQRLAEMINSSFETREVNSEQLQSLHRSVVDNLTRQIRDMQRKIIEQEETIEELNKAIETHKNLRKKQSKNIKREENDILNYQRTICEKEAKITDLKSTINEIIIEKKNSQQKPTEDESTDSDEQMVISLEKDCETDTKIKSMSETIDSLKQELKDTLHQLRNEKQNGFLLENKLQLLDRNKKGIEQNLASANERYALLEKKLKDKTDELYRIKNTEENSAVVEAVNETKKEYEDKIYEILENNRQNVSKAVEAVEKRYKKQLSELMKTVEVGEAAAAINELNEQHLNEISIIKKEYQDEIENLKLFNGNRLHLLTKHYETKISQLLNEQKKIQEDINKDLELQIEEKKIEIKEDFSLKMIDYQDKAITQLSDLRNRFVEKISQLEEKIRTLEAEKDTLKNIIEENDLLDEIPENLMENSMMESSDDDDALADSILQLKKREIEKDVSERYNLFLKAQRQTIEQIKNWEIEKSKISFQEEMNENLFEIRHQIMENLGNLRALISSNENKTNHDDEVENLIFSTLQIVENKDSEMHDFIEKQMIPLVEVESRLSETNEKIIDLSGENEFLRFTIKQLNNGNDLVGDNNEDLIRAMRSSISAQAKQISQTLREHEDMKARLEYYEQKEKNLQFSDELIQTDEAKKPICRIYSCEVFTKEIMIEEEKKQQEIKDDEIKDDEIKDEEITLRDNYNNRVRRQKNSKKNNDSNPENINDFVDVFTQTDEIVITKTKKKVKKIKNSSSSNEPNQTSSRQTEVKEKESKDAKVKTEEQKTNKETKTEIKEVETKSEAEMRVQNLEVKIEKENNETKDKKEETQKTNVKIKVKKENNEAKSKKEETQKTNVEIKVEKENNEARDKKEETQNTNVEIKVEKENKEIKSKKEEEMQKQNIETKIEKDNQIKNGKDEENNEKSNKEIQDEPKQNKEVEIKNEIKDDNQNDDKSSIDRPDENTINETNNESDQMDKDSDDEYEYEYEDNSPEIKIIKLNFVKQDCLFEINPLANTVECPNCHFNVYFDPQISEVSTTVDPVVECPQCHNSVVIDKEKYPVMFKDDRYNAENSLVLSPEEHSQIASMEESIQKQVQDLIKMKQQIRNEDTNNSPYRAELSTSLPNVILTLPTPASRSEKTTERTSDLQVSFDSLAIEIPALSFDFQLPSGINKPESSLSSRTFTTKFEKRNLLSKKQEIKISDAEQNIDKEITKLIEFKQELLSKKNSKNNSDDEDNAGNSISQKSSPKKVSPKLKLDEMPPSNNQAITNIASDLHMNDVQLKRTAKTPEKELETKTIISTSKQNQRVRLEICETCLLDFMKPNENHFLKSLAIQSVSDIDTSMKNHSNEPIQSLQTIEKAVLTFSSLNAFSKSDELVATEILQKTQLLKDIEPEKIPSEEVTDVVQSARKLLVSLCRENDLEKVSIKPLSKEAGGILSDDIEKLRDENNKFRNEIVFITEVQTKLKEDIQFFKESTKELKLRHEEIIFSLQKLIDIIVNSLKAGDGKIDKDSLNTLKDQAKYLIGTIKEKENLEADNQETSQLLKERDIQIISLSHKMQAKDGEIEKLSTKLAELTSHLQKIDIKNQDQRFNVENLEKVDKENKQMIDAMSTTIFQMKDNSDQLQKKLDELELANQDLQNKLVVKESEAPISYSFISPFIIFDTEIEPDLPTKGFTLIPGKNKELSNENNNEPVTEKIRVKYNQPKPNEQPISNGPRIIIPKTSQSKSRFSKTLNNITQKANNNNNDSGYVNYCPVHGEDRKAFMYIRQIKTNDQNNGSDRYYDRNPISGNVVLQKTITNLNRRIYQMQTILHNKAHELLNLRDQKNEARQNYYKATVQLQKVQRELTRANTSAMLNDERLNKAFQIIEDRENEIKELRDLIKNLRTTAQPVLLHQIMSNIAEDQSNLAAMKAFRGQMTINEIVKPYDVNPTLKRFAQRQLMVVNRWEKRRQDLIKQQQNHLLAVLSGMSLITSTSDNSNAKNTVKSSSAKSSSRKNTVIVTSMNDKKNTKIDFSKTISTVGHSSNKDFDLSWKNANANNQVIPPGMKEGVIAKPL